MNPKIEWTNECDNRKRILQIRHDFIVRSALSILFSFLAQSRFVLLLLLRLPLPPWPMFRKEEKKIHKKELVLCVHFLLGRSERASERANEWDNGFVLYLFHSSSAHFHVPYWPLPMLSTCRWTSASTGISFILCSPWNAELRRSIA